MDTNNNKHKSLNKSVHIRINSEFYDYIMMVAKSHNQKTSSFTREILYRYVPNYDKNYSIYY